MHSGPHVNDNTKPLIVRMGILIQGAALGGAAGGALECAVGTTTAYAIVGREEFMTGTKGGTVFGVTCGAVSGGIAVSAMCPDGGHHVI